MYTPVQFYIHAYAALCTRLCSSMYTTVQLYVHCSYVLRVYDWTLTLYSVLPAKYTTGILLYNPLCRYTVLADVACSVCASQDMYFSLFAVAACTAGMVSARLWFAMSRCARALFPLTATCVPRTEVTTQRAVGCRTLVVTR